jgi:hypothetical protein
VERRSNLYKNESEAETRLGCTCTASELSLEGLVWENALDHHVAQKTEKIPWARMLREAHEFVYLLRSIAAFKFTSISPQFHQGLLQSKYITKKSAETEPSAQDFSIFSFRMPFSVTASAANFEIPSLSFSTAICSSLKSNRKSASSSR